MNGNFLDSKIVFWVFISITLGTFAFITWYEIKTTKQRKKSGEE